MPLSVRDLFHPGTRTWNYELVHALFPYTTTRNILQTPVLQLAYKDKRIWRYTKDGQYSVKSRYRIYCDKVANKDQLKVEGVWPYIWNLHVPPKARSFLWRLLRGCVATRMNLRSCRINVDGVCVHCARGLENE